MTRRCFHCGQVTRRAPQELIDRVDALRLRRGARLVAEALLDAWPRFVTRSTLIGIVWDDELEGPENPSNGIDGIFVRLRRTLRGSGWTIETQRGVGFRFMVEGDPT